MSDELTKACTKCGETKPETEFYEYRRQCKACLRAASVVWKAENPDKVKAHGADHHKKTYVPHPRPKRVVAMKVPKAPEIRVPKAPRPKPAVDAADLRASSAAYYARNADAIKSRVRARRAENPEIMSATQKRHFTKKYATPKGKLESLMSTGIRRGLRLGSKANRRTFDLLGFTVENLRLHLESSFLPGMTWENHGMNGWHIDHIRPLASFSYETPDDPDFKLAWSISNLQPLWALDNMSKGAKWIPANDNQAPKVSLDIAA